MTSITASMFVKSANLENPKTYMFMSLKKVGQHKKYSMHCNKTHFFAVDEINECTNWLMWKNLAVCVLIIKLILLTIFILHRRFALPLQVRLKNNFGRLEESDGKINDVLILYSASDSPFAVGVLLPVLESKSYKTEVFELPENVATCKYQLFTYRLFHCVCFFYNSTKMFWAFFF